MKEGGSYLVLRSSWEWLMKMDCLFVLMLGFTHTSQKDAAKGFGGKYGVQQDRKDKVREVVECLKWGPRGWRLLS